MKTAQELQAFVRNKLKKGYPAGELRNDLLREGYTAEQVDKAIYDPPPDLKEIQNAERKKLTNTVLWYLGSIVLIAIGIIQQASRDAYDISFTYGTSFIVAGTIGLLIKLLPRYLMM